MQRLLLPARWLRDARVGPESRVGGLGLCASWDRGKARIGAWWRDFKVCDPPDAADLAQEREVLGEGGVSGVRVPGKRTLGLLVSVSAEVRFQSLVAVDQAVTFVAHCVRCLVQPCKAQGRRSQGTLLGGLKAGRDRTWFELCANSNFCIASAFEAAVAEPRSCFMQFPDASERLSYTVS